MRWLPGSLVVFEGLDRTGKTTQIRRLVSLPWERPPAEAHMPSGVAGCTQDIYGITESRKTDEPLAVQLLHLAAHVINMPTLLQLREQRGLVMDRCGWSPLAYGGLGAGMERVGVEPRIFVSLAEGIWSRLQPDLVFLFDRPFHGDVANTSAAAQCYRILAERAGKTCVRLNEGSVDDLHAQVVGELMTRGIMVD